MINHHPPLELLQDYAAGALTEGLALCIAAHVSLCRECAAQVGRLEAVGGALLEQIPPVEVGDDLLATVLARLDEPAAPVTAAGRFDDETRTVVPEPLRRYLGRSLRDLPWQAVGRMFHEFQLPLASRGMKVSLMRLRAGSEMPQHSHCGNEYAVVLAGGYRDADDIFGPGDFMAKGPADKHQPVVDADGDCICLVVLDAPLKFTGLAGLLVNPFLRF